MAPNFLHVINSKENEGKPHHFHLVINCKAPQRLFPQRIIDDDDDEDERISHDLEDCVHCCTPPCPGRGCKAADSRPSPPCFIWAAATCKGAQSQEDRRPLDRVNFHGLMHRRRLHDMNKEDIL